MADLVSSLVALLQADAGVAAKAGAYVFGGELPAAVTPEMPRQALVVVPSGGTSLTGGSFLEHDAQRVDLFAYGATPSEAEALLRAGGLALRRTRRKIWAGILIHWAQSAGGFALARDPDAAWPRAFQSFQVFASLEAVE